MDIISRLNYQRNYPNHKDYDRYSVGNYEPESALDSYIIARVEARERARMILDKRALDNAENDIVKDIVKKVDTMLKSVLP